MSQLYISASKIVQDFWNKNGSLKTLTFSNSFDKKSKLYALVYKTLKASDVLDAIYYQTSLSKSNIKNRALLYVMLYDHLFGRKLSCGGKLAHLIKEKNEEVQKMLDQLKSSSKNGIDKKIQALYEHQHDQNTVPKYIRINTYITEDSAVLKQLEKEKIVVEKDEDIEHLYLLKNGDDLHDHPLVQQGKIVIQSKPSCFPAFILLKDLPAEAKNYNIVDACAAPGNKTTQCASLLQSRGQIYACDKDPKRYELLQKRVQQMKCSNITCLNRDFLTLSPSDPFYSQIKAILLDPSCSGTGMTNNMLDTKLPSFERIKQLSTFQCNALCHAMSFSNVERITYSTCSIMNEENEMVVKEALKRDETHRWKLACALPTWKTRGRHIQGLTEDEANCLVRSDIDGPLDMEDPNIEQLKKFRKEEEPLESQQSEKKVISNPTTKHSHKKVKTNRVKRVSKVAL